MTYDKWHASLFSDTIYKEQIDMKFGNRDIKAACEKLHGQMVSDPDMFSRPIQEQRKHLFNILWKMEPKKMNWANVQAKVEPTQAEKEWQPVSWEQRAKYLEELQKIIASTPQWHADRLPPSKRMQENTGVRPAPTEFHRSPLEQLEAYKENVRIQQNCRRKFFLEHYPDASEQEVDAYIFKWKHIDDPDNIF